ncbi:MAG: V-type ATP synthase subunit D [Candidatus Aureabacteria bacterium]|nr:V-type ATP synthase subunit D [Candidatus Auribacterota bacterium]
MSQYTVAPTKSNLIKTKTSLAFAREGHELLARKRDILIAELLGLMAAAGNAQRLLEEKLKEAFAALEEAILDCGLRAVREASWTVGLSVDTSITEKRVMGVNMPTVESALSGSPPFYSPGPTSFWLDEAQLRFKEVLECLDDVAGTRISIIRLSREVKKTIRRVNALEKIYIPDYAETLKYIQDALEESDREAFFILKLIKERLAKKVEG